MDKESIMVISRLLSNDMSNNHSVELCFITPDNYYHIKAIMIMIVILLAWWAHIMIKSVLYQAS